MSALLKCPKGEGGESAASSHTDGARHRLGEDGVGGLREGWFYCFTAHLSGLLGLGGLGGTENESPGVTSGALALRGGGCDGLGLALGGSLLPLRHGFGFPLTPPVGLCLRRNNDPFIDFDLARLLSVALQLVIFAFRDRVGFAETWDCMRVAGLAAFAMSAERWALLTEHVRLLRMDETLMRRQMALSSAKGKMVD